MKKLKLFISLLFTMFSMVVFGQAEYEKIAITANTQDNSALKVSVQSSSNEINWKYIKDFQKEKEYLSTGLIKSGVISINGDNTKYNVSAGIGIITNFDDPENPTSTIVNFPAVVAKTPSYLTTSNITYVAINSSGTVTESATPFTPEQRRSLIILGAIIHSNLTNINVVNNISAPTNASTNQLHDLMEAIGALNLSGNKFSANNANLLINKSAGTIFKLGSNFVNDWKNPHVLGQSALTGLTFRYRTQNGTESSDLTSINPNVYDLNNVLTAVPSNRYSIQTITLFQSGLVRIQYGQNTYATISEAEAAISTRNFNVESNIALNGITRAYLLVKEGTTSLSNPTDAKFVDAGKFGSITSGGGAITLASIIAALGYTPENVANKQNSLTTDGSGVKYPTVDAVNTKVSNIDNTSDLNKPISTATQTALNLKENTANKNIANGYAGLGSDGKLISSQLPSITITDTFVVGSQSAMLSLVAETGDVAVRTDVNKSFILQGDTPSDIADWQELLTPTSTVSSVFGRTGAVTSNVGDYTADQISETASRKFQTLAQQTYNDATSSIQTQINAKANDASVVHNTGNESITGMKTFTVPSAANDAILINNSIGRGLRIQNEAGANFGLIINNATTSSATPFVIQKSGVQTFAISDAGLAFASNGTLIGGTGGAGYVPKYTGTTSIGNSLIYDNGTYVGIGTTSPQGKLHIGTTISNNATYNGQLILKSGTSTFGPQEVGGLEIVQADVNAGYGMKLYTNSSSDQSGIATRHNSATWTERLSISTITGNVGIGTTSPSQKLTIGDGTATGNQYLRINGAGSDIYIGQSVGALLGISPNSGGLIINDNAYPLGVGTILAQPLIFGTNNTERMRIASNGAATFSSSVTATGFFQSSDLRLKDIISRDGDVIKYKWKDKRDDKVHIGYVAQEVQKENPDQVNADDKGILSVNYIEILVQKIKDLENRIKQLEK